MAASLPLVTIVIPTYNQQEYIACAIRSALDQDYKNLEIIVADDNSKDGTATIVSALLSDQRLRYVRHESNLGRVANYRNCLRHLARGEWVLVLDGDDYLSCKSYISRAVEIVTSQSDIVLAFAKVMMAGSRVNNKVLNSNWPYEKVISGDEFFIRHPPLIANGTFAPFHLAALYHRETALALDFYRYDILSSDFESLYRLMIGHRIAFVDVIAGVWRQHDSNATRRPSHVDIGNNLDAYRGIYVFSQSTSLAKKMDLDRWHRELLSQSLLDGFMTFAIQERSPFRFLELLVRIVRRDLFFFKELPRTLRKAVLVRKRVAVGRSVK